MHNAPCGPWAEPMLGAWVGDMDGLPRDVNVAIGFGWTRYLNLAETALQFLDLRYRSVDRL